MFLLDIVRLFWKIEFNFWMKLRQQLEIVWCHLFVDHIFCLQLAQHGSIPLKIVVIHKSSPRKIHVAVSKFRSYILDYYPISYKVLILLL